jgi:hypothetical protein
MKTYIVKVSRIIFSFCEQTMGYTPHPQNYILAISDDLLSQVWCRRSLANCGKCWRKKKWIFYVEFHHLLLNRPQEVAYESHKVIRKLKVVNNVFLYNILIQGFNSFLITTRCTKCIKQTISDSQNVMVTFHSWSTKGSW